MNPLSKMNPLSNLNIDDLGRSPQEQGIYEKFKINVLKEFNTMEDYIKITYLDYNSNLNKSKLEAIKTKQSLEYNLIRNPYPYNISGLNIQHYVLFSESEIPEQEQLKIIKKYIDLENKNFIHFTNAYDKRSIKNLWHLHILVHDV